MKTRHVSIEGSDLTQLSPVKGVIHVAGLIHNPTQLINILWEVDGCSGSSQCEAWKGQYEIDQLVFAGYHIKGVSII